MDDSSHNTSEVSVSHDLTWGEVLVAIDLRPASIAAATWIATQLAPEARLTLVHCLEVPRPSSVLWDVLPSRDELVATLRARVAERLEPVLADGPLSRARVEVLAGHPGDEIALLAREAEADLVVTGRHVGRRVGVLGSTAGRLVASCHRPVLMVREPPSGPPAVILVPVDDSQQAAKALSRALACGRRYGAEVVVYHAVTTWYFKRLREADGEARAAELQDRVVQRARAWLERLVAEHDTEGVEVRVELSSGSAGEQVLAAIERLGVDLVVTGSHGLESLYRTQEPHLSRHLLLAAPCSVLVIT
ncbi:MAG: universal stress protein [Acidobacteriota bacterium]